MSNKLGGIICSIREISDHCVEHPASAWVFPRYYGSQMIKDRPKPVLNLGWLRRHHDDIEHPLNGTGFYVTGWKYGKPVTSLGYPLAIDHHDPVLIAKLDDGRFYGTRWADVTMLHEWLNRPIFKHYIVHWDYSSSYGFAGPQTCAIGGKDYADLPLRRDHPSRWDKPEVKTAQADVELPGVLT